MSKENSLPDFLKDLADGIRTAEGSTAPINPQDFRSRVEALSSGSAALDALIDGSITEISSEVTKLRNYGLYNINSVQSVNFPNVTAIPSYALYACNNLKSANFPSVLSIADYAFTNCNALTKLVIGTNQPTVATLATTRALNVYHFTGGNGIAKDGYIYVPDNLVDSYKSATNWSTYASQIKGISELPTEE